MGCHFLLQGIFPTQISNPGLPHCRQILTHEIGHGVGIYTMENVSCYKWGPSSPLPSNVGLEGKGTTPSMYLWVYVFIPQIFLKSRISSLTIVLLVFSLKGWGRRGHIRWISLHPSPDMSPARSCLQKDQGNLSHRINHRTIQVRDGIKTGSCLNLWLRLQSSCITLALPPCWPLRYSNKVNAGIFHKFKFSMIDFSATLKDILQPGGSDL